jgi:hypothetical protein
MISRVDLGFGPHRERLGDPTPLGLLGLAIGCAAITPVSFGASLSIAAFKTVAVFALLFGAGCQLLSGIMNFINKNTFGGTIFTCFSFLWLSNAWSFYAASNGTIPDHFVGLATEVVLIVIFIVLTYGFGHFSSLLFVFLLDIDLLFACRIIKSLTATSAMNLPIAILNIVMGLIALWLAFGSLINPVAGRQIFKIGGPLFFAPKKKAFDWRIRYNIFEVLYNHWRQNAFLQMPVQDLRVALEAKGVTIDVTPDLFYLQEFGFLILSLDNNLPTKILSLRLNAQGLDLYEQLVLCKYEVG